MVSRSPRSDAHRRAWGVLIGYNLPFALWTGWAMSKAFLGNGAHWGCPVRATLGLCPGCGLTTSYARLLRGDGLDSLWLGVILVVFVGNFVASGLRARRIWRDARDAQVEPVVG